MLNDWETPLTVDGVIVRAWIGEEGLPDTMHVQGVEVAEDIGNLDRVIGNPENPDPDRPFLLVARAGTFARHGYYDAANLVTLFALSNLWMARRKLLQGLHG